jgi:hypothetical protein
MKSGRIDEARLNEWSEFHLSDEKKSPSPQAAYQENSRKGVSHIVR